DPLRVPVAREQQRLPGRRGPPPLPPLHHHPRHREAPCPGRPPASLPIPGGIAMLVARFVPLIAALALGASVGRERTVPFTAGTLRTDTGLFAGLLTGVIVVIGALTFLPGLALGPIVEQLQKGLS